MDGHRFRAPSTDGTLLAAPPLADADAAMERNAGLVSAWNHDFQGCRSDRLRNLVRGQVVAAARSFLAQHGFDSPLESRTGKPRHIVVSGHQPEIFHPGVWVKNFALAALTPAPDCIGLNLIVDNDILKAPGIRVPHEQEGNLRAERIEFDEWRGEVPYEDLRVADEAVFETFRGRVRRRLPETIADPVIDVFWPRAVGFRASTDRLGLRFALARHAVEESWGTRNLEVPLSAVCESEGFSWFVSHILAQLPRFQAVHNEALTAYRARYGIRSRHHPVPDLAHSGEWLEAPFWVWRPAQPRRRSLQVRQRGRVMDLRIDGDDTPFLELPLAPDREACCAVEQLQTLPTRGIRLRTRALTTTMFARLLLSDLFLHGIGGAKYDELGDAIIQEFFGIEPPLYMTLSMTLWLGLGGNPDCRAELARTDRLLRDVEYKPELWLDGSSDDRIRSELEAKRSAIIGPRSTPLERRERFQRIRQSNAALKPWVEATRLEVLQRRDSLREEVQRDALARHREYSLVLHSQAKLRAAFGEGIARSFAVSGAR